MFHYISVISYQPGQLHRTCSLPMSWQQKFYKPPLSLYQFQFMLIFSIEGAIFYSFFPWIKEFSFSFLICMKMHIYTQIIYCIYIFIHIHIYNLKIRSSPDHLPRHHIDTSIALRRQYSIMQGFPSGAVVKNLFANAGATGSIPALGRFHMHRGS